MICDIQLFLEEKIFPIIWLNPMMKLTIFRALVQVNNLSIFH